MNTSEPGAAVSSSAAFFSIIGNRFKYRMFLLKNLPAAYFSGLQIVEINEQLCSVSVPFKWFTQNPFRSTYFACLSMAAEMTTGVLAMAHIYKRKPSVSMLIVSNEAKYHKKATGKTVFTCPDGLLIKEAVEKPLPPLLPKPLLPAQWAITPKKNSWPNSSLPGLLKQKANRTRIGKEYIELIKSIPKPRVSCIYPVSNSSLTRICSVPIRYGWDTEYIRHKYGRDTEGKGRRVVGM